MTQPTPLEQIDLLLAAWDERLRRMDENLVALESEAIYQILAGKAGKRPALEGVTKAQVGPALDAVSELFENRERLAGVVGKAREVRATISALAFWEKDEKIAEIHKLLRGTSIELGPKVVALSERSLFDQSYHDVFIEPEQLVAQMATRFQEARTVLLAVSQAWEALDPEMAEVETRVVVLRALAADIAPPATGAQTARDLARHGRAGRGRGRARAAAHARRQGSPGRAERHRPDEAAPRGAGGAARPRDRGAQPRARGAHGGPGSAPPAHRGARACGAAPGGGAARGRGGAAARLAPALDEALLAGLDEWMHKLEATVAGKRWSPAEIGLNRWRTTAEGYQGTDAAAAAGAEALLARRGELAGRLSARRAQAAALGARGLVLDPSFEAHAREAEVLLRQRPVHLDEATRAVEHYEAAVVALGARRGGGLRTCPVKLLTQKTAKAQRRDGARRRGEQRAAALLRLCDFAPLREILFLGQLLSPSVTRRRHWGPLSHPRSRRNH